MPNLPKRVSLDPEDYKLSTERVGMCTNDHGSKIHVQPNLVCILKIGTYNPAVRFPLWPLGDVI